MSFANLSSAQVRQLIGLIQKKESLQAKLDRVDQALQEIESGGIAPKKRGRKPKSVLATKPGRKARRGKRGKRLKEPLLAALKAAGSAGIKVKDLAAKLKVKPSNVFSWFYTTGKKVKGIKKVGEAKYALAD
jgi:hypothetical protein